MRTSVTMRVLRSWLVIRVTLFTVSTLGLAGACGGDAEAPPLEVASSLLSDARQGAAYTAELVARGGVPPYAWAQLGGQVPGLFVTEDGRLSGTPTAPGTYTLEVRVTDSRGETARQDLALVVAPGVERMRLSGSCDAPTALSLSGGPQTVLATLPATGEPDPCQPSAERVATVFALELARPAQLLAAVVGEGDPTVALVSGDRCDASAPTCGRVLAEPLPAGQHLVFVSGAPGSDLGLTFELDAETPTPPGPGTCQAPETLDLASGRVLVMGIFEGAGSTHAGSCTTSPQPEVVYAFELTEAADVTVSIGGAASYYVRSVSCEAGQELACGDARGLLLPNLQPGRYFVFVEPRFRDDRSFSLDVRRSPPTTPAPNASCAAATAPTFVNGLADLPVSFTNVPAEPFDTRCGDGSRGLYYRVELSEPGTLEVTQLPSGVAVELLTGSCAAPSSLACADFDGICSPTLEPGSYLVRVSQRFSSGGGGTVRLRRGPPRATPANDTCAAAQTLTPGTTVMGGLVDATDAISFADCSRSGASEIFYSLDITERSDVVATLSGAGRSDAAILATTGGCAQPSLLACLQSSFDPLRLYGVDPGRLDIVVEQRFPSSSQQVWTCRQRQRGEVSLSVAVQASPPPPVNDTCATTSSVGFPRGVGSIEQASGTTSGASSSFASAQCSRITRSLPAPDVVWAVDVPASGRLRVEAAPASFDTFLSLHAGACSSGVALACGSGNQGIETTNLGPGRYWLRVDGTARAQPGSITLTLTLLPPT